MNVTEDELMSQIDDLFFDISPPQCNPVNEVSANAQPSLVDSHNGNMPYQQTSSGDVSKLLAVRGSKIEPPLNWSPSPRQLLLQNASQNAVGCSRAMDDTEVDLETSASSWLHCSQTSLSLSNNSDWLRDSHERIMKGGQLSEEELELSGHGVSSRSHVHLLAPVAEAASSSCSSHVQVLKVDDDSGVSGDPFTAPSHQTQQSALHLLHHDFNSPRMLDLSCLPEPLA